jgi:hypothetical protein
VAVPTEELEVVDFIRAAVGERVTVMYLELAGGSAADAGMVTRVDLGA